MSNHDWWITNGAVCKFCLKDIDVHRDMFQIFHYDDTAAHDECWVGYLFKQIASSGCGWNNTKDRADGRDIDLRDRLVSRAFRRIVELEDRVQKLEEGK